MSEMIPAATKPLALEFGPGMKGFSPSITSHPDGEFPAPSGSPFRECGRGSAILISRPR